METPEEVAEEIAAVLSKNPYFLDIEQIEDEVRGRTKNGTNFFLVVEPE